MVNKLYVNFKNARKNTAWKMFLFWIGRGQDRGQGSEETISKGLITSPATRQRHGQQGYVG